MPGSKPTISVLLDVKPRLGEGALWDSDSERLHFIDCLGNRLYRCTADGCVLETFELPTHIGSMALMHDGKALLAMANGFYCFDFHTHESEFIVDPEPGETGNRLNDGKCDRQGRFVCGSMHSGESDPTGHLWSLGADALPRQLDTGIICSNGPCFSPDGRTLYFADSFRGTIYRYAYDPDTGAVSGRENFITPDTASGAPDGATVDEEGCLWTALVFDGRIQRWTPDGQLDREITMPVCKCTSVAFGGPELDVLYVTSMAHPPLPRYPGDGPLRGATFRIDGLGVRGLPEARWAG